MELVLYVVSFLAIVISGIYLYFKFVFSYWKRRGFAYVEPSFPLGNIGETLRQRTQMGFVLAEIYSKLEGHKVGGFFEINRPTLMVRDIDVVKDILMISFGNFHDRGMYHNEEKDPLMGMLFALRGKKWKVLRAKLTPTFTSHKMRGMYSYVEECARILTATIKPDVMEVGDLMARYTTDVVASCAFGIQCNCLTDQDAEFRRMGKDYFARGWLGKLELFMTFHAPALAAMFNLGNTPRHVSEFFMGVVRDTIDFRKKSGMKRNDFMQLMMDLKETDEGSFTYNEIASQAFMFYLAGFETSSATLTYALYELAMNADMQTRLRKETRAVLARHGGHLTYDAVRELEYAEMVVMETSRLRPIIALLSRVCTQEYRLPDSDLVVEEGTPVVVPVYSIHHDPRYYPDPERFDPERFNPEQRAQRNPYTFLSFGEGPRVCIGTRFAMTQMKVALASLISRFEVRTCAETVIPPVMDPEAVFMMPKGGLYLRFVPIEGA